MFHYSTISPSNVAVNQVHMLLIVSSLAGILLTDIYELEFIQCPRISLQQSCKSSYTQGLSEINQHFENISQQLEVLQGPESAFTVKLPPNRSFPFIPPLFVWLKPFTFLPFSRSELFSSFPNLCIKALNNSLSEIILLTLLRLFQSCMLFFKASTI